MAEDPLEIPKPVMAIRALVNFTPAKSSASASILANWKKNDAQVFAGWALARLVAWALFDQKESKSIPKAERKNKASRRPFIPKYAYKAGQLYLLYHLYSFFRTYDPMPRFRRMSEREALTAIMMYLETLYIKKLPTTVVAHLEPFITTKKRAVI